MIVEGGKPLNVPCCGWTIPSTSPTLDKEGCAIFTNAMVSIIKYFNHKKHKIREQNRKYEQFDAKESNDESGCQRQTKLFFSLTLSPFLLTGSDEPIWGRKEDIEKRPPNDGR